MLLHQAAPAFERWFGRRPEVTPELRALIEADVGAHEAAAMIVAGLTGSIAMGKSTVAAMFAEFGAPVFDADAAVRAFYSGGGRRSVVEGVFPGVVVDGRVDRDRLSQIVLNDPTALGAARGPRPSGGCGDAGAVRRAGRLAKGAGSRSSTCRCCSRLAATRPSIASSW